MSRQNKVNPGIYTQRGRLTPDDAARELRKQSAIGSPHTWQPANTRTTPRRAPAGDATRHADRSADSTSDAARSNARAKAAKAKTSTGGTSTRTTGSGKVRKAAAATPKQTTTTPPRKAVLARNAGGRVAAPRPITKRGKR